MTYVGIIITFVFVHNFVLSRSLGICPFIGVSGRIEDSVGLGFAITFTASLSSLAAWTVHHGILLPLGVEYLQTPAFILVIAGLVRSLEGLIKKISPGFYKIFGGYLPLVTTNCAVFGIALISVRSGYNAMESFTAGFAAGAGYFLAVVLMATLRDSMRKEWIPKPFRGIPITFISAGLMALAFMAFDRALLKNLIG